MNENNDKKNSDRYLSIFMGIGLVFDITFELSGIGLLLGVTLGIILDSESKKTNN